MRSTHLKVWSLGAVLALTTTACTAYNHHDASAPHKVSAPAASSASAVESATPAVPASPSGTDPVASTASPAAIPSGLFQIGGGTLYVLTGLPDSGNVWRLDLTGHHAEQLTHNRAKFGVSWLSGSPAGLALADAASGIDNVSVLRAGRSVDLAGHGGTPAISDAGQVAYIQIPDVVNHSGQPDWRIQVIPDTGGTSRTLYKQHAPDIAALAWGPHGQVAVISAPGTRAAGDGTGHLLIIAADGHVEQDVLPKVGAIGYLAWSSTAPGVAVAGDAASAELVAADGSQTLLPPGWLPQCWNPAGSTLLMTSANKVGLWRLHATTVQTIAETPGNTRVTGCAWLSKPATGA